MLRGSIALVVLVLLVLAYCCELAQGTATPETHQAFWTVIGLSAVFTAIAFVWDAIKNRKR